MRSRGDHIFFTDKETGVNLLKKSDLYSVVKVAQLCLTVFDLWTSPWNSPGQNTRVGSLSLLQGSSQPRDRTWVSHSPGRFFTSWATREAHKCSLCLCLYCCPANRFIHSIFHRFHIYALIYDICIFLFLTYFTLYNRQSPVLNHQAMVPSWDMQTT